MFPVDCYCYETCCFAVLFQIENCWNAEKIPTKQKWKSERWWKWYRIAMKFFRVIVIIMGQDRAPFFFIISSLSGSSSMCCWKRAAKSFLIVAFFPLLHQATGINNYFMYETTFYVYICLVMWIHGPWAIYSSQLALFTGLLNLIFPSAASLNVHAHL